jgi:hypothetical protein
MTCFVSSCFTLVCWFTYFDTEKFLYVLSWELNTANASVKRQIIKFEYQITVPIVYSEILELPHTMTLTIARMHLFRWFIFLSRTPAAISPLLHSPLTISFETPALIYIQFNFTVFEYHTSQSHRNNKLCDLIESHDIRISEALVNITIL